MTALPAFAVPRNAPDEGSPVPVGTGVRPPSHREGGLGTRPQATVGGRGYRLSLAQIVAVRALSQRINWTVESMAKQLAPVGVELYVDANDLARKVGIRPARLRALLEAGELRDDELELRAANPGHLRRPRRSTLARIAEAWGAPESVVDLWCRQAPDAIAPEAAR